MLWTNATTSFTPMQLYEVMLHVLKLGTHPNSWQLDSKLKFTSVVEVAFRASQVVAPILHCALPYYIFRHNTFATYFPPIPRFASDLPKKKTSTLWSLQESLQLVLSTDQAAWGPITSHKSNCCPWRRNGKVHITTSSQLADAQQRLPTFLTQGGPPRGVPVPWFSFGTRPFSTTGYLSTSNSTKSLVV